MYLASGLIEPAVEAWQRARGARPGIPTLHRNLGMALLQGSPDYKEARAVLEEGTTAVALAEAGEASAAERLFHDRFFPSEEGGTSVRAVYAQIRLSSAKMAADGGNCITSREILDSLSREQPDLAFAREGLAEARVSGVVLLDELDCLDGPVDRAGGAGVCRVAMGHPRAAGRYQPK